MAEERMKEINEQNQRVQVAKYKQREFYVKYLKRRHQEDHDD